MSDFGFAHFLDQTDIVGQLVLGALLLMSLISWTVVLIKVVQLRASGRSRRAFQAGYAGTATPAALQAVLGEAPDDACRRLATTGFAALARWSARGSHRLVDVHDGADFVLDRLMLAMAREREALETGLAALAAVGSTAPFVGLLGTVWGIYHALVAIGISGQGTLDKVAGPVGEALVMTAIGLAVAIPAVLAYNAFVRACQRATGELEDFAHELLAFMATGVHAKSQPSRYADQAVPTLVGSA